MAFRRLPLEGVLPHETYIVLYPILFFNSVYSYKLSPHIWHFVGLERNSGVLFPVQRCKKVNLKQNTKQIYFSGEFVRAV